MADPALTGKEGILNQTAGVYMLQAKHAATIAEAGVTDAAGFVAARVAERDAGTGYSFAIEDQGKLVGVCGIRGIAGGIARELELRVGRPFRGKGYGTLGVRMLLEFAFRNLGLTEVRARAPDEDPVARRVLEKNGFQPTGTLHAVTAVRWREVVDGPALAKLHPALRTILDEERAAGNEIVETQMGWPDEASVFVRLRHPFQVRGALPDGVRFAEIDDPHWWTAEYTTERPRHVLAY